MDHQGLPNLRLLDLHGVSITAEGLLELRPPRAVQYETVRVDGGGVMGQSWMNDMFLFLCLLSFGALVWARWHEVARS